MGNTVIPSYIVDCYPLQSMSDIIYYSVFLDLSALINPVRNSRMPEITFEAVLGTDQYLQVFIAEWVAAYNYTTVFTVAGITTFGLSVPVIALVHKFGPKIRERSGVPGWVNPEYDTL